MTQAPESSSLIHGDLDGVSGFWLQPSPSLLTPRVSKQKQHSVLNYSYLILSLLPPSPKKLNMLTAGSL